MTASAVPSRAIPKRKTTDLFQTARRNESFESGIAGPVS